MVEELDDIVKCSECNSRDLERDEVRGELVCGDCGLVLDDKIVDQGAEWRVFTAEDGDRKARVGAPMSVMLHDKGLSTDIDWQNKDYSGKAVNSRYRSQLFRMRKWQKRARVSNSTERNLSIALAELDRMGSRIGLPKAVREASAVIYRKCVEADLIRGRSIEGCASASLYIACRQCGVPRTLDEICAVGRTGRKEVGRTQRFILRELKIRLPVTRAIDYISRFASALSLDASTELIARQICETLEEKELDSGRGPTGLAASTLYIASILNKQHRTQREIAKICGVTEVTIRNRYKEISKSLDLDLEV
tara:strand:+ start:20517 stop:21440 length:924 start_codon:yes stop_codon:yes gene_type:complete